MKINIDGVFDPFVTLLAGRKFLMSRSCYLPRELEDDLGSPPDNLEEKESK